MATSTMTILMRPDDWSFLVSRSQRFASPHHSGRYGPGPAFRAAVEILQGVATAETVARMFRPLTTTLAAPQCAYGRGVRCRPIRFGLTEAQEAFVRSTGRRPRPSCDGWTAIRGAQRDFADGVHQVVDDIRWLAT